VRSKGLLSATGVCDDGKGEILGFSDLISNSRLAVVSFHLFEKERPFRCRPYCSDNHCGLVAGVKKYFHNISCQRCRTHFSRNALDKTPKKLKSEIKQSLKEIYIAPKIEIVRLLRDEILETYGKPHQWQWKYWNKVLMVSWPL